MCDCTKKISSYKFAIVLGSDFVWAGILSKTLLMWTRIFLIRITKIGFQNIRKSFNLLTISDFLPEQISYLSMPGKEDLDFQDMQEDHDSMCHSVHKNSMEVF